jgi:serine/threonine protein kinase
MSSVHRWLYDHAGILHGDLSLSNIMYRIIEGKVHGVLTDYDLSSWKATLAADDAKSPQQVPGTPPYMAQELLTGTSTTRLYRHDVESLFYVMLVICGHHTISYARGAGNEAELRVVTREGELPYLMWFECHGHTLGCVKGCFLRNMGDIELSPSFQDFGGWLLRLQYAFSCGFSAKQQHRLAQYFSRKRGQTEDPCGDATLAVFDDESLGGNVRYSSIIEPVRHLTGGLEGLVIRYDPSQDPLRSSADAVPSA